MAKGRSSLSAIAAAALIMSLTGCAGSGSGETVLVTKTSETQPESSPEGDGTQAEGADGQPEGAAEEQVQEKKSLAADPTGLPLAEKVKLDLSLADHNKEKNYWETTDEKYSKFLGIMERECEKDPNMQGVYLLANDDKVIFCGGINSTETDGETKVNAYTTYEIGSLTKAFTGTAILQLREQGKLSLDDPITKYFPEFEKGKDITLLNILQMKSGLQAEFFDSDELMADFPLLKKYYTDGFTDEEMLKKLFSADPVGEPGYQTTYSNAGYVLLAMVIEQVTGESYADYVQKNIFDVCGMEHSTCMVNGGLTSVPVLPSEGTYEFDPYEVAPGGYSQWANSSRGAGDIHSCCADLLAFDRALTSGQLINEESLGIMFGVDMVETPYSCGWMFERSAKYAYSHAGSTPFYMADNLYVKSEKYGNMYLVQLHSNVDDMKNMQTATTNICVASGS